MTTNEAEAPPSNNRMDSVTILHNLLIAEDDQSSAHDLIFACLLVGGVYLLGFLVPGLVPFLEQQPVYIQILVGLSSAALAFRGMGLLPVAFVQYLLFSALLVHGAFLPTPLGAGGSGTIPATLEGVLTYILLWILAVGLYSLPHVPAPAVLGFVLGRLGRVAHTRYGPVQETV